MHKHHKNTTLKDEKEVLIKFGQDCWELVQIVRYSDNFYFYFKRPITLPSIR
jgi:hypothetical protein